MAKLDRNADNRLADLLLELKRHLRVCKGCIGAVKTRDKSLLCDHTIGLILTAAVQYDTVIPRRVSAHRKNVPHVFACPDISAHGKAFAITAEPLIVVGTQDALF